MGVAIVPGLQVGDLVRGLLARITLILDVLLKLLLVHSVEQVLNLLICVQNNEGGEG
jgi:hypothetical protein